MKNLTLDGRLGRDAEIKTTQNGKQYLSFSLANDVYNNGKNDVEWYTITSFDPHTIEKKAKYLTKGRFVIISGEPVYQTNVKDGRIYLNINVRASGIELPRVGIAKSNGETEETLGEGMSVYTDKKEQAPKTNSTFVNTGASSKEVSVDEDLPF